MSVQSITKYTLLIEFEHTNYQIYVNINSSRHGLIENLIIYYKGIVIKALVLSPRNCNVRGQQKEGRNSENVGEDYII